MFGLFLLAVMTFMLWIGYMVCGAMLAACFWAFILVPVSFVVMAAGLGLCCTLILIPIGWPIFKFGWRLLIPGI